MIWPEDADGDVFRRLEAGGFNFAKPAELDFNVDFATWPPDERALQRISVLYPDAISTLEDEYVLVRLRRLLTYDLVLSVQEALTDATATYGGCCESWGVVYSREA